VPCCVGERCARPGRHRHSAATVSELGLIGTWASYCTADATAASPARVVFAEPPGGAPTYTTVSAAGAVTTTVRSVVLEAAAIGPGQVRLRLRIIGGDRDRRSAPDPTTEPSSR